MLTAFIAGVLIATYFLPTIIAWFERHPFNTFHSGVQQRPDMRKIHRRMTINHRRFPLCQRVIVGNKLGKVIKHDHDYCNSGCLVKFNEPRIIDGHECVDYGVFPFARLRRLPTPESELR